MRRCLGIGLSLALALIASDLTAGGLEEVGQLRWREGFDGFGSYSGLALSADGRRFVVVSDKGSFATGQLTRAQGVLTAITLTDHGPLLDPGGDPVRRYDIDAEGLTVTPDGRLWVSFEANHRVWSYTDLRLAASKTARHPQYGVLQNNSSLEALASDHMGAVYTIPERSGKLTRPFPVHRFANGSWSQTFVVPRSGKFLVVGAEFGPDDRFYVLERDFRLLGFRTRIRSFALKDDALVDEHELLVSPIGRYDNLEGIAVWRDEAGAIRVTCVSDDNGSIFQRTEFVEFILRP